MCIEAVNVYWNGFFCGLFGGSDFVPETPWIVDFLWPQVWHVALQLLCAFFVWSESYTLSLLSRSYLVLGWSQNVFACVWLRA